MLSSEVDKTIERMNAVVRSAANRRLHRGAERSLSGECVDWLDPFEELARREEEALADAAISAEALARVSLGVEELPEALSERIQELVFDQFRQYEETFMEWLFAAGPHPLEVMKRLFAYAKKKRASLLWNMGFRELGKLLGESHAAVQWRCRMLFGNAPSGWNKSASSVEKMRDAQRGNHNRWGGKKI